MILERFCQTRPEKTRLRQGKRRVSARVPQNCILTCTHFDLVGSLLIATDKLPAGFCSEM